MILKYPVNYIMVVEYFKEGVHNGLDLGWGTYQQENEPVFACADGEVISVRNNYNQTDSNGSSYGNFVKIKHSETLSTLVAHLKYQSVTVKVGDKVKMGDLLGIMGQTGHAYAIHVHYEVFINNKKVNPILYTYVFPDQKVSSNPNYSKDLLYYKEPEIDIETLKKMIEQLENENANLREKIKFQEEKINNLNNDLINIKEELKKYQNIFFTFKAQKTSFYLIKLYENETLFLSSQ